MVSLAVNFIHSKTIINVTIVTAIAVAILLRINFLLRSARLRSLKILLFFLSVPVIVFTPQLYNKPVFRTFVRE